MSQEGMSLDPPPSKGIFDDWEYTSYKDERLGMFMSRLSEYRLLDELEEDYEIWIKYMEPKLLLNEDNLHTLLPSSNNKNIPFHNLENPNQLKNLVQFDGSDPYKQDRKELIFNFENFERNLLKFDDFPISFGARILISQYIKSLGIKGCRNGFENYSENVKRLLNLNENDPVEKNMKLFSLLLEYRPQRMKWSNLDRLGQEELYPHLESAFNILKAFSPFSSPFINRVSKREVPDYYLIIKNPMDLMTMAKKLKNFQYNSKKEFLQDLKLIKDNCYTYNTIPDCIYLVYADALFEKGKELLANVPDIIIRNRSELKNDTLRNIASLVPTDAPKDATAEELKKETLSPLMDSDPFYPDNSEDFIQVDIPIIHETDHSLFAEKYVISGLINGPESWNRLKRNKNQLSRMFQVLNDRKLFFKAKDSQQKFSLVRSSTEMGLAISLYNNLLSNALLEDLNTEKKLELELKTEIIKKTNDERLSNSLMRILSYNGSEYAPELVTSMMNGIPEQHFLHHLNSFTRFEIQPYKPLAVNSKEFPKNHDIPLILWNVIEELTEIRCLKAAIVGRDYDEMFEVSRRAIKKRREHHFALRLCNFIHNKTTVNSRLKNISEICVLLNGFEGYNNDALSLLTELGKTYMLNMTSLLSLLISKHSTKLSIEGSSKDTLINKTIIKELVKESGLRSIKEFKDWIDWTTFKFQYKVQEIKRKLTRKYESIQKKNSNKEEKDESILLNGFHSDDILGLDILGLKELGLGDIKIPEKLLSIPRLSHSHSKRKSNDMVNGGINEDSKKYRKEETTEL